jgi:hypothetical protein
MAECQSGHWSVEVEMGQDYSLLEVDDQSESVHIHCDQELAVGALGYPCNVGPVLERESLLLVATE